MRGATLRRLAAVPWHPPLFAAAWVISAWVAASPSPYAALRALVVVVAAASGLTVVGRLLFRTWQRGAIAATLVVLVVAQGRDASIIAGNMTAALPAWQLAMLVLLVAAAAVLAVHAIWRPGQRPTLAGVGRYLTIVATILCVLALAGGIPRGSYALSDLQQGVGLSSVTRASAPRAGPDIYVILLDGYPRADTLQETYGFDNSGFLDALRTRGFWVDPSSHSNYLLTELSLTSFFNMALVQDLPELDGVLDGRVAGQPTTRRALNDNRVFADLRGRGYTTVSYAIPFEDPALRRADVYIELGGVNEFERTLIASTFLLDLMDLVNRDALADQLRNEVRAALEKLPETAANDALGSHMVFAHLLAPHAPFLFDAAGNPITSGLPHRHEDWVAPGDLSQAEFQTLLTGEIQYVNRSVLDAIDRLLAVSDVQPVVIVMSDHGVRERPMDPETVTSSQIRDAFGSLFAAYTPGRQDIFPPGTTPSQVMARLMNAYFDETIPLASSDAFISTGNEPFRLIPVSDALAR